MSVIAGRVLTRRQERVLVAFADGLVGKQVAKQLGIGESTVRHEMSAITRKLGAQTGSQAIAVAHEIGLLPALAELISEKTTRRYLAGAA